MMKATADFDFDAALLEFGLPSEMMTNINRGPQHTCGLDYRIIPLDSPGIKKMKNSMHYQDEETDDFYVGKIVKGYSGTDNKIHRGRIVNFVWNPDDLDEIQSIVILDDETMKEVEVLPNSAVLYVPSDDKETIVCDDEGF